MNEVEKILNKFGTELVQDLQANLDAKMQAKAARYGTKFNSSSRLRNSIKFFITSSDTGIVFNLSMNDYGGAVDGGRIAAGVSQEGQKSIERWANVKGVAESLRVKDLKLRKDRQSISKSNNPNHKYKTLKKMPFAQATKSMAFLVARKLKQKGYEGNHFMTEILQDGRLDDLSEYMATQMGKQIQIEIKGFK